MAARQAIPFSILAILGSLSLLTQMSTFIYLPSMPSLSRALDADPSQVKLTVTSFLFAIACGQLIFGPLSDRYGRRPIMLSGMALFVVATILCAAAPSIEWLIVGRAAQGLGACAGQVITRAIIRDLYDRDTGARVMAFVGMALTAGPALGPVVGGQLDQYYGWRAGFMLLTVLGPIPEVKIQEQGTGLVKRRSMMRIMARRTKAATVVA